MKTLKDALPPGRLADEMELFIQSATDRALFLCDAQGRVTSWTPGAELLTGWRAEEIIGLSTDLLYTDQDREAGVPAADRERALGASPLRLEEWRVRRDGSEFLADVTLVALRGSGSVYG